MLEIFTKDALCLLFLNTLLTLAWRAPDIGEFLSQMMEIANSHSKVKELNGWRIINNPLKSNRTSFVRITSASCKDPQFDQHPQGLDVVDARCRGPGGRWWAKKTDFQMCCKGCWLDLGLPVEKFSQSNVLVLVGASTLTRYLWCQVMETKSDRATAACYTCCRIRSKRGFSEKRQAKLSSW